MILIVSTRMNAGLDQRRIQLLFSEHAVDYAQCANVLARRERMSMLAELVKIESRASGSLHISSHSS